MITQTGSEWMKNNEIHGTYSIGVYGRFNYIIGTLMIGVRVVQKTPSDFFHYWKTVDQYHGVLEQSTTQFFSIQWIDDTNIAASLISDTRCHEF